MVQASGGAGKRRQDRTKLGSPSASPPAAVKLGEASSQLAEARGTGVHRGDAP